MSVDPKFLKDVQRAGWRILWAEEGRVAAKCPNAGCTLTVHLYTGDHIPKTCSANADLGEIEVKGYEDARRFLREVRERLCLNIDEVEDIAGMASGHLLKAEKDNPDRSMSVQGMANWAQALGYRLVLRPAELPPITLRYLADTRGRVESRRRTNERARARRRGN